MLPPGKLLLYFRKNTKMHPALHENKSRIIWAVLRRRRKPVIESISQKEVKPWSGNENCFTELNQSSDVLASCFSE